MKSMRAAVVDQAGPPEAFRILQIGVPAYKESEVLVRQKYAGINFGDIIRRKRGLFPSPALPPHVLGFEGVGIVEAVGKAVSARKVGDRVAYLAESGGYAELVSVPAAQTWAVPASVTDEAAAGITCVGLTAWGLIEASGVRPGDASLVHGAAGGVGSVLIQILAGQGVRTIALVKGDEKLKFVVGLGADVALDRGSGGVETEIRKLYPAGVDVVFDCVGQDVLGINLAVIRPGGAWMYYGSTSGHPQFPGDRVLMNRLCVRGFVVFELARDPSTWRQATAFLSSSLLRGALRAQTTHILPLTQVSEAHRLLESRAAMGKVLLAF